MDSLNLFSKLESHFWKYIPGIHVPFRSVDIVKPLKCQYSGGYSASARAGMMSYGAGMMSYGTGYLYFACIYKGFKGI